MAVKAYDSLSATPALQEALQQRIALAQVHLSMYKIQRTLCAQEKLCNAVQQQYSQARKMARLIEWGDVANDGDVSVLPLRRQSLSINDDYSPKKRHVEFANEDDNDMEVALPDDDDQGLRYPTRADPRAGRTVRAEARKVLEPLVEESEDTPETPKVKTPRKKHVTVTEPVKVYSTPKAVRTPSRRPVRIRTTPGKKKIVSSGATPLMSKLKVSTPKRKTATPKKRSTTPKRRYFNYLKFDYFIH